MIKQSRSRWLLFLFLLVVLAIFALIGMRLGSIPVNLEDILSSFTGQATKRGQILWSIRYPRIVITLLAGLNLGLSGLLIQSVLKNPITDSNILGINAGASLLAVVILILFPEQTAMVPLFAFVGGGGAFLLVGLLAFQSSYSSVRIVLTGLAIRSVLGGLQSVIVTMNSDRLHGAILWLNGNLSGHSWQDILLLFLYALPAYLCLFFIHPKMDLLQLEDGLIHSLGYPPKVIALMVALVGVYLAAITVSFVGMIGFVGLIIPHVARLLVGGKHSRLIPFTGILGAILLILADTLSRTVIAPLEIPIGTTMSLIGGPFFLYLLYRQSTRRWSTILLTAKDISYSYGRQSDFHLSHISLSIQAGSVTGLIGPNGSGKTTLFDCLNGRKTLANGQVIFEGQNLHAITLKERAKKIAVVQQSHRNQLLLSVRDIVSLGRSPYQSWLTSSSKTDQDIVDQVLDMVGLSDYRDKQLQELSGGQRQLVWLALALAQEPDLLFLDEPTTYLDIRNQIHFLNLIRQLNEDQGLTVVMILHDLNQVLRYCDYAYLLSEGELVAGGKPAEILSESIIEETYQVHSDRLHHPKGHFVLDFY